MNPLKELQLGWGVDNVEAGQSISGSENRCLLPAALAHHCCPTLSHTGQLYWPQPSDLSAQLVPTTPSTSYLANQPTNIFMMSESRICWTYDMDWTFYERWQWETMLLLNSHHHRGFCFRKHHIRDSRTVDQGERGIGKSTPKDFQRPKKSQGSRVERIDTQNLSQVFFVVLTATMQSYKIELISIFTEGVINFWWCLSLQTWRSSHPPAKLLTCVVFTFWDSRTAQ